MSIIAAITAALNAFAEVCRVFPLWLMWQQSQELEKLNDERIDLENRADPRDDFRLRRLRVKISDTSQQHAALLAIVSPSQSGAKSADSPR